MEGNFDPQELVKRINELKYKIAVKKDQIAEAHAEIDFCMEQLKEISPAEHKKLK